MLRGWLSNSSHPLKNSYKLFGLRLAQCSRATIVPNQERECNMSSSHAFHRSRIFSFLVRVLLVIMILIPTRVARADPLPGFIEIKVFDGLDFPTAVQFASDGRV